MAQILIERSHQMGLEQARRTAQQWMDDARSQLDLRCEVVAGTELDEVHFSRAGLSGTLEVSGRHFRMQAQLGFVFSAFKQRIESEIEKNLDRLIGEHKQQ